MKYMLRSTDGLIFKSGAGVVSRIDGNHLLQAVHETSSLARQISAFPVNIFEILGMRNLSAFIGELFAASLIRVCGGNFIKNPHQDGYPDLLLVDENGRKLLDTLSRNGQLREKGPFSPFANGGLEIKATCGSVPDPAACRRLGMADKPGIGDQRIGCMKSYDWKAHHRETNNLVGLLWDFVDNVPQIAGVFFCSELNEDHWGRIVQPKEGGGRTTSVSIMTRAGVRRMYEEWVIVADDPQYIRFLNRYNNGNLITKDLTVPEAAATPPPHETGIQDLATAL